MWSTVLRNRKWLYWLPLMLPIVVSFAINFTSLNSYIAPPGPDYGNYLTQVSIINGHDIIGLGLRYNPIFYVLLDPFLTLFDELTALKIVASIVFSVAVIPFFLLAKKLSHSYLAALITSWTFVFFEGYSEMIAWGGNPNFLGFSFMLLTLFFIINSFEQPSKKYILLSGLSLSLVIGTHFLVTAFVFLLFFIFFIMTMFLNRENFGRIAKALLYIIGVSAVFSLPYIPVYNAFAQYSSSGLVGFNFLQGVNAAIAGLEWMFRDQTLIIITMAALGILALWAHAKENRNEVSILCGLFILPFILGILTEDPDRWFYFLPIPVMLSFAVFLGDIFAAIKHVKSVRTRKVTLLLTSCFILAIIVIGTIFSVNRLEGAINYYQSIGNDEIQALNWVKENTAANATFSTSGPNKVIGGDWAPGNSYSWWIEGISQRKCFGTGFPTWYTYEDERSEAIMANRIFAGNYVFEFNDLRVSDNFPAPSGNPQIAVLSDGQYQNVLFMNDAEDGISFSPNGDQQVIWSQTPFYAGIKTMNVYHNQTWGNATFSYSWPGLELVRSVIMNSEQPYVDVIFKLTPLNSTLRQFTLDFWVSFFSSLQSYEVQGSNVTLYQTLPSNEQVETRISILETNGALNNTQVFLKDPKYSMPLATYSLTPLQNSLFLRIRISIITKTTRANNHALDFYNSYNLINDLKINYVFLNKNRMEEYDRFLNDPEHFKIVFENGSIIIFRVI